MEIIKEGYTRISDILSIFQSYAHVPRDRLKKAQEVGTVIHAAIEDFYKGKFSPVPLKYQGYFDSFLKFAEQTYGDTPKVTEERFYDEFYKITGRIDLVTEIDNEPVIIDFKTGSWAHPEMWRLQGTFYRHFISMNCWPKKLDLPLKFPPDKYLFVQLTHDGTDPIIHRFNYSPEDWEMCVRSIELYRYLEKYRR